MKKVKQTHTVRFGGDMVLVAKGTSVEVVQEVQSIGDVVLCYYLPDGRLLKKQTHCSVLTNLEGV